MAFGKQKEALTAPVTVHLGGGESIEVVVALAGTREVSQSAVWANISTNISQGSITGNVTTDGRRVVVNWQKVAAVTY